MRKREKMEDKSIWNRLDWELYTLSEVLMEIAGDKDYHAILRKNDLDPICKAAYKVYGVRTKAESRMLARTFVDDGIFYHRNDTSDLVKNIRQLIKEAAEQGKLADN